MEIRFSEYNLVIGLKKFNKYTLKFYINLNQQPNLRVIF